MSELDASIGNIGNCIILLSPDKSRLYVRDDKTSSNILAINSVTGQLIWKRSLTESSRYQTIGPVWQSATNGKPQIGFVNNSLANSVGVLQDDGSSSSIVWTKNVAKSLNYHWWGNGSTSADNSRLYVTSFSDGANPVVSALDTTTGNFVWQILQTASNGMNQFQNCAVGADGTIYSPGRKGSGGALTAIRPDGTIKWQYVAVGSAELISWPVVTTNGIVYVADNRNILFGIKDEGSAASPVGQWQLGTSSGDQAPSVGSDGTLYVTSGTNDVAQVLYAYSPGSQDIPDLQVSGTTAPTEINTDASFRLSWMVKNIGKLRAEGIGRDKIYLSTNNQFDPGVDTLLGDFPLTQALDPGQSIERTQPLTIPRNKIPSGGQYYLIVYADANNNINEGGNEINNVQVIPVTVQRPALPDLAVQSIEAPATAFFDQTITVRWTVKNIGGGSTNASGWQDWVYLSSDEVPEIEDPFKIPVQNISYLAAGESYVASVDIRIPRGLAGAYKIIVYTDFDGTNHRGDAIKVKEENELNNWDKTKTIQINIPLLPDLTVTTVQTPDETFAGSAIPLSWRIDNKGGARTEAAAFTDHIYLAKETTFNPATARLIGENKHTGLVAANDGYNVSSFTANIPFDSAGDWNVFIVTDAKDEVYEFVLENNNSNYDRRRPLRIRATPPDLIVQSVTAPATATAARQIAVNWTVKNQGAFDAGDSAP